MKYLNKREEFLSEAVLVSLLNETVVYYSPQARDMIRGIYKTYNLPLAFDLIMLETEPINADMTLIDISDDGKYFTYKTSRNITKLVDDEKVNLPPERNGFWATKTDDYWQKEYTKRYVDGTYPDEEYWKEPRGQVKIGRFINNVFPNKYANNDVEDFSIKVRMRKTGAGREIKVVEGDEIIKWYNEDNSVSLSTLGSSCMRGNECKNFFDIYTKNPEICKMVCIFENDKVAARALIWKVTKKSTGDFEWFMDRRYYAFEELDSKLKDYAIENGWAFKTVNSFTDIKSVTYGGKVFECDMEIQLENYQGITKFPYVDTFKKYYPQTGILKNVDNTNREDVLFYKLDSTGGSYTRIDKIGSETETRRPEDSKALIYSEYYDEAIDAEEAIWSEWHGSWIYESDAIHVTRGEYRGWYPEDSDDLVYVDHLGETVNRDDCTYSDYYDEYIFADYGVEVVSSIEVDGDCPEEGYIMLNDDVSNYVANDLLDNWLWFDYFKRKWNSWRHFDGVHRDLLTKDYSDCWIPKKFALITYEVQGEDFYLSEEDSKTLGLVINPTKTRKVDAISYDDDICQNEEWYNKILPTANKYRKERLEDLKTGNY